LAKSAIASLEDSVNAIQRDRVLGIPAGMTVGGIAIRKESGPVVVRSSTAEARI
jgi:hypothetical protein